MVPRRPAALRVVRRRLRAVLDARPPERAAAPDAVWLRALAPDARAHMPADPLRGATARPPAEPSEEPAAGDRGGTAAARADQAGRLHAGGSTGRRLHAATAAVGS